MTVQSDHERVAVEQAEARNGALFGLVAFGLWGFYGLFFGAIGHINALEIVAHRAFWSVPIAAAAVWALGRFVDLPPILADRGLIARLLLTSLLVAVNWGLFVWAVATGRTLETSLGYYINPLLNVLIGYVLLNERLTPWQLLAVAFAALAVAVQTVMAGVFPWLALVLAGCFAAYGYLRKTMPVGPVQGYLVEATILSVFGVGIIAWLAWRQGVHFGNTTADTLLLIASGPMTALPLMLFSAAARRIRLATLGLMQYIAPSGLFVTAVFAFGEPLDAWRLASFALIWSALAIYSLEALRLDRLARARATASAAAAAPAAPGPAS